MRAMMSAQARKQAKQRRSRVTVDAIVEAAARVVSQVGLDRANTNRIADQASLGQRQRMIVMPGSTATQSMPAGHVASSAQSSTHESIIGPPQTGTAVPPLGSGHASGSSHSIVHALCVFKKS